MSDKQSHKESFAEPAKATPALSPAEVIIGNIETIDSQGQPMVYYAGIPGDQALPAISTVAVTAQHIGRQAALLFANGDPSSPVIIGLVYSPLHELLEINTSTSISEAEPIATNTESTNTEPDTTTQQDATIDGKRVVLEGKEEIVLKCGDASITLTKAGKISIRGKYLINRSSGVNRIMGGSVQVN